MAIVCGFFTVLVLSGTANTIIGWLGLAPLPIPKIAFTWYIMFGSIVTFLVGLMFRTKTSS
jgi:hypothetical protein